MTELIWDGKYDKDGRKTAPLRVALPFQTVETVNESAQERQHALDLFSAGRETEWRNRLIWGDKRYVLPHYEPDFVTMLGDGSRYLIETKGREDVDLAHKDRAARLWCENATLLTGVEWN